MKKYGQYEYDQTTMLDSCILQAFKNEYDEQIYALCEMQKTNIEHSIQKDEKIYNNFNLAKGNQLFQSKGSNLFNQSTLLFHDMSNIDENTIRLTTKDGNKNIKILSAYTHEFHINNNSFFDLTELSETMSYFDAVKFAYEMQKSSNGLLYGILLKRNSVFINPLHPIVAQSLTKKHQEKNDNPEYNSLLNNQFNVFIYTYNKEIIDNVKFELFNDSLKDTFKNHIFNILAMLEQTFNSSSTITKINDIRENKSYIDTLRIPAYEYRELSYDYTEEFDDKENEYNVNIEPVQVVNDKLIYPYYGIVAQKYSMYADIKGYQLSPMLSPNIGAFHGEIDTNDNKNKYNVSGRNICTGNLSRNSENGWRSLNHANLGSPYFKDILSVGSFTFAKLCVDMSLNVYAKFLDLELLNIDLEQKESIISFITFKEKKLGTSFKEYIKYCKQQGN